MFQRESQLHKIIKRCSFSEGNRIILTSGLTSNYYFDMKYTMSNGYALQTIAELMLTKIRDGKVNMIGGLAMGAIPIVSAISIISHQQGYPIDTFWIRKHEKGHGLKNLIEGQEEISLKGKTVVIVEDVTTTGDSVIEAIRQVKKYGANVERVITIVDRCEGARKKLLHRQIALTCLFSSTDFRSSFT